MAVYSRPVPGIPPWVRERAEVQGYGEAAQILRGLSATATSNGDSFNAAFFTSLSNKIESSSGADPSGASARVTFMAPRITASATG
jgi:hypothetical protein